MTALVDARDHIAPGAVGRGTDRIRLWASAGLRVLVAALAVPAVWAALAALHLLGPGFVGPVTTVRTLADDWSVIWYNAYPTVSAALTGALVLLAITAAGMLAVGLAPELSPWLVGLSVVAGSLPLISLTSALSLFVERGAQLITVVTVLSGLVPVAATLASAAQTAQRGRDDVGAVYSAGRVRWWLHVGFWRCIPTLDIGLRAMLPACFVGAIVAEWSGASGGRGLGGLMANALFSYQVPLLWATLLLAALVAFGLLVTVWLIMKPLQGRIR